MTLGGGIFLVALGAILTFAVNVAFADIDIAVIGVILMLAGIAVVMYALFNRRRVAYRTTTERPVAEFSRERVVERDPEVF